MVVLFNGRAFAEREKSPTAKALLYLELAETPDYFKPCGKVLVFGHHAEVHGYAEEAIAV